MIIVYSWGHETPDARIFDAENQFRALRTTCHKLFTNDSKLKLLLILIQLYIKTGEQ